MIVGLTGGIGSGKTTVEKIFAEFGVPTTSADALGKDLLTTDLAIKAAVMQQFKNQNIVNNDDIDRKKLRTIIFASEADRIWLEQLMHPAIKDRINAFAKNCRAPYCVIEIPLLYEAQWQDCVDRILIVDVPEEMQLARTSSRDQVAPAEIKKIMATQLTRQQRLAQDADIITNIHDLAALRAAVTKLHQQYLQVSNATPRN